MEEVDEFLFPRGTLAPDFTVEDVLGNSVTLSAFRGQIVILDFWATWCYPCTQAMPHLQEVAYRYRKRGVVVLAVNVWDDLEILKQWMRHHPEYRDIRFAIDPEANKMDVARTLYHAEGVPTQYVLRRDGTVYAGRVGYGDGVPAELEADILALLDASN